MSSLLWKISRSDCPQPSYIFGTMHLKDLRAFHYKDAVEEKIRDSSAFATEFRLDDIDPDLTEQYMQLPSGLTLNQLLKPKRFEKIDALIQSITGQSLFVFNHSKPMVISNIITESLFQKDMPLSLDATLYEYAKSQNKTLLGLETYEEQLEILEKIPLELQVKGLWKMVKNYEKFQEDMIEIATLYENADLKKLYKKVKKSSKGLRKLMIYDRNKKMVQRFITVAVETSICAAIGAGHLGGKKGILHLLRQKGFTTTPIFSHTTNGQELNI